MIPKNGTESVVLFPGTPVRFEGEAGRVVRHVRGGALMVALADRCVTLSGNSCVIEVIVSRALDGTIEQHSGRAHELVNSLADTKG